MNVTESGREPDTEATDDEVRESASSTRRRETPSRSWIRSRAVAVVLVLLFGAVGLAAAAVINSTAKQLYASNAVVRVYNPYRLNGSQFGSVDPITITNLELQYAESHKIKTLATAELRKNDIAYDKVVWTPQPDAATISVKCYTKRADDSVACAEAFADVYVTQRSADIAGPLKRQIQQLSNEIDSLTAQVKVLQGKINSQPSATGQSSDRNRGRLAQQQALLSQIANDNQTRADARGQAAVLAGNYQVVASPKVPNEYAVPTVRRNLAVGIVAGLLLGLVLALALVRPADGAVVERS